MKIEKLFLLLFIPFAFAMTAVLPPTEAPDEYGHFIRSWLTADGQLLPPYSLPENYQFIPGGRMRSLRALRDCFCRGAAKMSDRRGIMEKDIGYMECTAVNSRIAYLPQALSIRLVRFFSDDFIVHMYAARIGNLLFAALLMFFAIRMIPCGKFALMGVCLLPMTLQEVASMSIDGGAIGCAMLTVAFVLSRWDSEEALTGRDLALAASLSFGLVSFKFIYMVFVSLLLLLAFRFRKGRRGKTLALVVIGFTVIALLAWVSISLVPLLESGGRVDRVVVGRSSVLLPDVKGFLACVLRTLPHHAKCWIMCVAGWSLSWFDVDIGTRRTLVLLVSLLALSLWDEDEGGPGRFLRFAFFADFVLVFGLMLGMFYFWWTPTGSPYIEGIQGRYFLPVLPALLLALRPGFIKPRRWVCHVSLLLIVAIDLTVFWRVLKCKF